MQKLKEEFTSHGFFHKQVVREDDIAIFRRTRGKTEHFEVVIIKVSPQHEAFGITFPEMEKYPYSEQWGLYAWTCRDMDAAWDRVRKIRAEREAKAA